MGVKWNVPEDQKTAIAQLVQFDSLDISILEVESKLAPEIWPKIDSLGFEVYGNLGIRFPLTSTFARPDSSLIHTIQVNATTYLSQPSVTAIGLFEYGATHKSAFFTAVEPIANQLKKSARNELYYISQSSTPADSVTDFSIFETHISARNLDTLSVPHKQNIGGYLYAPSKGLKKYLSPFKKFLEATSISSEKTIFLYSDWLLTTLDQNPRFSKILKSIATQPEPVFPLPKEDLPSPQSSALPIIILLLIWGTIAWHYNVSPLYRKSLFRYFTGHKFFIDDIFDRHIRSSFPAIAIILQNALLISASTFVSFAALFTPLGQSALFHHFPNLAIVGSNLFSLFVWTFSGMLLTSLLSIIWLYIAHRNFSSFTQVATIYAWPLQLNFVFCTIAITLFSAGADHSMIIIFTALALLLFILSFVFTSLDTYRFAKAQLLHLLKTIIPYLLIWVGLMIWILTKQQWMDVINLALNLK